MSIMINGQPLSTISNDFTDEIKVNGIKIIGAQQSNIGNPSGGTFVDGEARTAINSLLTSLKSHGLLASE